MTFTEVLAEITYSLFKTNQIHEYDRDVLIGYVKDSRVADKIIHGIMQGIARLKSEEFTDDDVPDGFDGLNDYEG